MMYGWLSSARMERSAHTCTAWCMRTISLFRSIFNAKKAPVSLCLTSLTRPKPPVPVFHIHTLQHHQHTSPPPHGSGVPNLREKKGSKGYTNAVLCPPVGVLSTAPQVSRDGIVREFTGFVDQRRREQL
jgi:hypothetical protein